MAFSPRVLCLLVGLLCLIFGVVTALPTTEGGIPAPEDLEEWLLQKQNEFLTVRPTPGVNSTLHDRGIVSCLKSLCCFGSQDDGQGGTEMAWACPTQWPTLDDLKQQIQNFGNVGRQISFFYTGLGGGGAIKMATRWAGCHTNYVPTNPGFVTWNTIVDDGWYLAQASALMTIYGNIDPFQKLLSQAFAEVTAGDVYLFTPASLDPNNQFAGDRYTVAWVGWEYPALTRNGNVRTIYRVDPTDAQNDRSVLWTPANGPSSDPPLGLYNAGQPL